MSVCLSRQRRDLAQHLEVLGEDLGDAGTLHLHDDLEAVA
jgi:hypothetical protein